MIEFKNVTRHFGNVVANDSVSFRVKKGTIHGIVGENGAGKSTAMNMLYGLFQPTAGEIWVNGKKTNFETPSDAVKERIGMVHQHFMLAGALSIEDNLLLGHEADFTIPKKIPLSIRLFKRNRFRKEVEKQIRDISFEIPLHEPVENVSVGVQQRIEILKLLLSESDILILDEPTAVLTPREVDDFLKELKKFRAQGKTILIITHKLKEVLAVCDEATVFRAGKVVDTVSVENTKFETLSEMMVGRILSFEYRSQKVKALLPPVLKLDRVDFKKLSQVSLSLSPGEILGIAGVEGNGQQEMIDLLLFGNENFKESKGEAQVFGKSIFTLSPKELRIKGLSYLPQDRHKEGVLVNRPLWENYFLGNFEQLNISKMKSLTRNAVSQFKVKAPHEDVLLSELSGGNQQKFVVARELSRHPKLLIAAHPTRGVDLGAIELIHEELLKCRDAGTAILLFSSELDELMKLSDRLCVLYRGSFTLEIPRSGFDERVIGLAMAGQEQVME